MTHDELYAVRCSYIEHLEREKSRYEHAIDELENDLNDTELESAISTVEDEFGLNILVTEDDIQIG